MKSLKSELWMVTDRRLTDDLLLACSRVWPDLDALILREKDWSYEETKSFLEKLTHKGPKRLLNWTMAFDPWDLPIDGLHLGFDCAKQLIGGETDFLNSSQSISEMQHSILAKIKARKWLLGASIHSIKEWETLSALPLDYVLLSNIFETSCKPGKAGMGLTGLQTLITDIRKTHVTINLIGLGGLRITDGVAMAEAGLQGIALRSELH